MVRRWIKTFGIDEARSLAEENNSLPPLILRTNTLKISRDDLLELFEKENMPAKPTSFSPKVSLWTGAFHIRISPDFMACLQSRTRHRSWSAISFLPDRGTGA